MRPVSALRDDLLHAGYTVAALNSLWGPDAAAALHRASVVPARRAIDDLRGRLHTLPAVAVLAECFLLGSAVSRADLDRSLPTLTAAGAQALGLVASDDDGSYRAALDLRPYAFSDAAGDGEWWIVSDLGELATGEPLREDHVLGIGGASTTLSGLQFHAPAGRVLDLGTGSGIQAMHARRSAGTVIATDISDRALELTAFNAELNAIERIELRAGSLFEPVAGERFDRIVSNPPFVITPRLPGVPAYEYRDGGLVGDALVQSVLRGIASHLEPGGTAQLLGNWEYRTDAAGAELSGLGRVEGWLDETGLDYWVVERDTQTPSEYAETWIRDGGTRPGPAFDTLVEAWLDDFAVRGVQGVGFGYVVLRAPAGGASVSLRRAEQQHGPLGEGEPNGIGAHLERCLAAHDAIVGLDDSALGGLRLRVAGDVTEERHYWPGQDDPTVIRLRQGGGFARVIDPGTALAALVGASDGELSVDAIVGALADLLDADAGALRAELLPAVRELVTIGVLELG